MLKAKGIILGRLRQNQTSHEARATTQQYIYKYKIAASLFYTARRLELVAGLAERNGNSKSQREVRR